MFIRRIDDAFLCLQIVQFGATMKGEAVRINWWCWFARFTHMCV